MDKYLWVKYADDRLGNGISDSQKGKKFVGTTIRTSPSDSSNPDYYDWNEIK